ncbi:MAG: 50S ribosomal protein L21 [Patescibacteria group bacterium]|nr:50S ribosomal protein L21 [Patescibacteria group bacterium]
MLGVIQTGGKQYLVREKDKIEIEKIKTKDKDKIIFDKILLVYDDQSDKLFLGNPFLAQGEVEASLVGEKIKKTLVWKFKSKTRYRKKKGYKKTVWQVRIEKIKIG